MTVNLSAVFTKKNRELFGLNHIEKELLANPLERRYAVVQLDAPYSKKDNREGVETPTAQLLHIEPTMDDDDTDLVKELLLKLYRKRINKPDAPPPVEDTLFDDNEE